MPDAASKAETQQNPDWICLRERETVRSQIIAAAQDIQSRKGLAAVTLAAIVRETKIPRATVYSIFTSRRALVAVLTPPPEPAAQPENAAQEQTQPAEAACETSPQQAEVPAPEAGGASDYDALMRQQAEALEALTRQVIVPKPFERSAREQALSRLDARLSVTEQSVAALEQRFGERLKALDTDTGMLSETLKSLRSRLEKFEERQVAALAELRLDVHHLSKAEKPAAVAEIFHEAAPAEVVASVEKIPPFMPETVCGSPAEPKPEVSAADDADIPKLPKYLAAARLAALQAAAVKSEEEPPHRTKSPVHRFVRKNRWLLLAAAGVLVAWFDVYVFAHYQPALGDPRPVEMVVTRAARPAMSALTPRAQLLRGLKYLNGTGVPVNIPLARLWLERSARGGNPVAENLMGVLYQTGTGVPSDKAAAMRWYEAAAAQGNLKAMTNLGKIYAGGWEESTDYAKAAAWFSRAAAYGEVDAQFDLAILYERGAGVSRNPVEAYKWYMIAGKAGDNKAALRASTLAAQLEPTSLEAADSAIAGFAALAADRAANEAPQLSG